MIAVDRTAEFIEPAPTPRRVWRRALPWVLVFGPFALAAGAGVGYLTDTSPARQAPPVGVVVTAAPPAPAPPLVPSLVPSSAAPLRVMVAPAPHRRTVVKPTLAAATTTVTVATPSRAAAASTTTQPTTTSIEASPSVETQTSDPGNGHGPDTPTPPGVGNAGPVRAALPAHAVFVPTP